MAIGARLYLHGCVTLGIGVRQHLLVDVLLRRLNFALDAHEAEALIELQGLSTSMLFVNRATA